jgi:DNA-binding CsgD family transcriptional regulator
MVADYDSSILGQIMPGLSNKRSASNLPVAVDTVKTHVKSILRKLDAASRTEAVAIAQRRGILGEEHNWRQPRAREIRPIAVPSSGLRGGQRAARKAAHANSSNVWTRL